MLEEKQPFWTVGLSANTGSSNDVKARTVRDIDEAEVAICGLDAMYVNFYKTSGQNAGKNRVPKGTNTCKSSGVLLRGRRLNGGLLVRCAVKVSHLACVKSLGYSNERLALFFLLKIVVERF